MTERYRNENDHKIKESLNENGEKLIYSSDRHIDPVHYDEKIENSFETAQEVRKERSDRSDRTERIERIEKDDRIKHDNKNYVHFKSPEEERASRRTYELNKEVELATRAGFGRRFVAFVIDSLIAGSISAILIGPLAAFFDLDKMKIGLDIFSLENMLKTLVYFLYFILMTYFFNATLGKMILGLKVINNKVNDNHVSDNMPYDKLPFMSVVTRELFGRYISNFLFGLPYLVVLFNPNKEGVHDMLSDTLVIKENKEKMRNYIVLEQEKHRMKYDNQNNSFSY